jgi:hypothetical protein
MKTGLFVLLAIGASALPAGAQLALEVRGGGVVGNHAPAAAGLETVVGPAWAVALEQRVLPLASLYFGYSRSSFGCEQGFCTGREVTFTSQGLAAGARLHPRGLPWLRAGALYHGVDTRAEGASESRDAGPGFELATGFVIPLPGSASLLPGLAYRRHSSRGDDSSRPTSLLGAELALRVPLRR